IYNVHARLESKSSKTHILTSLSLSSQQTKCSSSTFARIPVDLVAMPKESVIFYEHNRKAHCLTTIRRNLVSPISAFSHEMTLVKGRHMHPFTRRFGQRQAETARSKKCSGGQPALSDSRMGVARRECT